MNLFNVLGKISGVDPKAAKTKQTVSHVITAIVLVAVAIMFFLGVREPRIYVTDDIIISGMYGLTVEYSEITDITLIEKSMSEIGTGKRTNGFGGPGNALKGFFELAGDGKTLLFVSPKSSPTIRIERADKENIYISLRDSEDTQQLYNTLKRS